MVFYWPTIFPYGLNRSSKSFFSMSEVGKFPTKIRLSISLGSLLLQVREKRPGDALRLLRRDMTRSRGFTGFFLCASQMLQKKFGCSLISVFKLSSTILKHVSELREEIKSLGKMKSFSRAEVAKSYQFRQWKCCGKIIHKCCKSNLKQIALVNRKFIRNLVLKKHFLNVSCVSLLLTCTFIGYTVELDLHVLCESVPWIMGQRTAGHQCMINAEHINKRKCKSTTQIWRCNGLPSRFSSGQGCESLA